MDKRRCYWIRIKDDCHQTAIRLISFGVYSLKHNYPLKICETISFEGQKIAVVIDTTLGFIDIPICIMIEDTEELTIWDVKKMDFLDKETKDKICKDIMSR